MSIKEALIRELETLPEARQADVLSYVRFVKSGLADAGERRDRFAAALETARGIAAKRGITDQDIAAEIEAVRKGR
ncbi:MAG: hypothetical protein HY897_16065 [Deltaproteobacteria bacterium]|nr:hypothetical protein [Deltaproteobacteria bacterium]